MSEYKLREPIGDEAYQQIMCIGYKNEKQEYGESVKVYIRINKVTENGISLMQEELIHRVSEVIIRHYHKKIDDFISKLQQEKREQLENGITIEEPKQIKLKRKVAHSKFTQVAIVPLPDNPQKGVAFYVKDIDLGNTEAEQKEMIAKVTETINGQHHKHLCEYVNNVLLK